MSLTFMILALVTLAGAVCAMVLRNLVHCAVGLVATFAGLAGLYLQLNAQFVGLVQLLVYVGAVAILIVFAILLTRSGDSTGPLFHKAWAVGLGVALATGLLLAKVLGGLSPAANEVPEARTVATKDIGLKLMSDYILPLEVVGLLLTAALIGAVILAMHDKKSAPER